MSTETSKPEDDNMSFQLKKIQEAAKLAFDNNDYFVQILDTIIAISMAQPLSNTKLQSNCVNFIYRSFVLRKIELFHLRADNALKLVDMLQKFIVNDEVVINTDKINYTLIQKAIEIFAATYDFMFLQLIKTPDHQVWAKISHLKDFLISKWPSAFPLLPLNKDTDLTRSIGCKIALAKLLTKIIQTQLPYPQNSNTNTVDDIIYDNMDISISLVNKDHPFLYTSSLNTQGQMMIDYLLNILNSDSLLPTSFFSTLITLLMSLFKTRPNFTSNKTLNFILAYESQFKNPSKFETNKLKIRLNRRFNDRIDRVLMSMLLNRGFIDKDVPLKTRFGNKLSYMVEKSNKQKKRGILSEENDVDDEAKDGEDLNPRVKRAKVDNTPSIDYFDESKIAKSETFKSIYTLINPKDDLAHFDISSIPSEFINNIVILGLSKVDNTKLNKGLEIISSRYTDLFKRLQSREDERAAASLSTALSSNTSLKAETTEDNDDEDFYDPTPSSGVVKQEDDKKKDFSDDDFDFELESKKFELPVPRILDPNEKKEQIKLIVDNFIKSSAASTTESKTKTSWLRVLTRLATRGTDVNPEIAEYIRESLFNYFKEDVKGRIDGVIEWLNEEYYSEFIVAKKDKYEIPNSSYMKYASLVLDYLIPFLEPNDRNIFIRLLSELPYLDLTLLSKLKSVCNDPVRSKTGFQPLLYLIMFRPPVFNDCIQFLVDLYNDSVEKNNEQLQNECLGYLKKYKPDAIPQKETSESTPATETTETAQAN